MVASLQLLQEVLSTVHEKSFQTLRQAAPRPEAVRHVEEQLCEEAKLHHETCAAYDFHMAAARMEQKNMRELALTLGCNKCYTHSDYMEKLPVPISGSETSDMFHGRQRKTLSVFPFGM